MIEKQKIITKDWFEDLRKEIIKVLVVASLDKATLSIFGRSNLGNDIVNLSATVNDSYVSLKATPTSDDNKNSKLVYNAFYFQNQNLLRAFVPK